MRFALFDSAQTLLVVVQNGVLPLERSFDPSCEHHHLFCELLQRGLNGEKTLVRFVDVRAQPIDPAA